ncbi:DUF4232 domain-containing protein [Streptomyces durmitorensis]|uniref:DUF4232 domain-containing protein n=1 Tax=Streptomyces durmitorensis TaxID=319947 RepID=A0ABY4PW26_9ACTN|nr:DUF4232 domain-containing protein [Streptomyces durmitorensis]UQT57118.1 DUF4232 domain-containing protein [Streptomyces durmitorensis]
MRFTAKAATAAAPLTAALSLTALGGAASAAAPAAKSAPVTCTAATTEVTVEQVDRPLNHLLLKAKNTGTKTCYAYGAPYLRFDEAQSATGWLEDSTPQAVVTLKPGRTAYAAIGTSSPEGSEGRQAHELGVHFANRTMNGSVGAPAAVKLPRGGVHVDSSAYVTYWQTSASDALMW